MGSKLNNRLTTTGATLEGIRPQLFPLIGCIENGYNSTQDSSLFNGL